MKRSAANAAGLLLGLCLSCAGAAGGAPEALIARLDATIPGAVALGWLPGALLWWRRARARRN